MAATEALELAEKTCLEAAVGSERSGRRGVERGAEGEVNPETDTGRAENDAPKPLLPPPPQAPPLPRPSPPTPPGERYESGIERRRRGSRRPPGGRGGQSEGA